MNMPNILLSCSPHVYTNSKVLQIFPDISTIQKISLRSKISKGTFFGGNLLNCLFSHFLFDLRNAINFKNGTGGSRLMQISLLRISLLWFFKTITKIWLMRFYGLFILLLRTQNENFANAIFA